MKLSSLSALLFAASVSSVAAADFQLFEGDGFDTWTEEGTAFGRGPASGILPGMPSPFTGYGGGSFAGSGHGGDAAVGRLISPEVTIADKYLHFLIAGGKNPGKTAVQLLVQGKVVLEANGSNDLKFRPITWDLTAYKGQKAKVRVLDDETGKWGIIAADNFVFSNDQIFTQQPSEKSQDPELVANPVIAGNNIPKGTKLELFATHQEMGVTSPTAIAFDEQGALYVAETNRFRFGVMDDRGNRYWYYDDLASKTTADRRALHEKWKDKVSIASMTEKSEIVRKVWDTNGDGKADKFSIYADKFNDVLDGTAGGVFAYLNKVYFACIPTIHILEDTKGTGVADKREKVADGFGVHISLSGHDMNGFALGMDGRIYGTIGDRSFNITTKEGKHIESTDRGAVFRFEPDGSNFEVVHTGLRNPKEIAFDEFGNGVTVDNNSDQGDPSRIVYIMDGVDSGWRIWHQALHTFRDDIGLPERPISPWMTEKMANLRNDDQPAYIVPPIGNLTQGPCGLTYYPGTGFQAAEKGRFLICDYKAAPASSGIFSFKLKPDGAGLKFGDSYKFNSGVCPTDVEYGYDGRLYVADFIGGWESAQQGRIYTLTAEGDKNSGLTPDVAAIMKAGIEKQSDAELVKLLSHADQRIRTRAHIALAARPTGTPLLIAAAKQGELLPRLHGTWGLGIRARKNADKVAASELATLLKDNQAEVRAQAAHLLGEVQGTNPELLIPLLKDASLRVRAFAALSLGRLQASGAYDELITLLQENADKDLYLRHAGIMGLLGAASTEQIAQLKAHASPFVRMAAVVALRRLESPYLADFLTDKEPKIVDEAIRAIHEVPVAKARPAINALLDGYIEAGKARPLTPMIARRLVHSAFRTGGKENAERLIKIAAGKGLDLDQRLEAMRLLLQWAKPMPVDQSLGKWDPLPDRDLAEVKPIFEAGIPALLAADEAILGPTLALVEQLQLSRKNFSEESLLRIVNATRLAGPARSTALDLWLTGKPQNADAALVKLASDANDQVATEALSLLIKRDPAKALEGAIAALGAPGAGRRQAAWTIIGNIPGEAAAAVITKGLKELIAPGGHPDQLAQIELLEAGAKRKEPTVAAALAAYQQSLPAGDLLAAALPALMGGDPVKGGELFRTQGTAQCIRCHQAGEGGHDTGGDAGPNLAGVFQRHPDRRYLLESLIVPMAQVAPGYGVVGLSMKNGQEIGGVLNEETKDKYIITMGPDVLAVNKADVKTATPPISAMPPMTGLLSLRETRDIVAWLATLDKPIKSKGKRPEPKPYVATK